MTTESLPVILIADDSEMILDSLASLLQHGYRIVTASSGEACLKAASAAPPDLILLDVMMPEMDGYEVLRRLRADDATRDVPVIFVTALGEADNVATGLRLGASDYIPKPIQPEIVLARVRTQLEVKRARDGLKEQNSVLEAEVVRRVTESRVLQAASEHAQAILNHQRKLILESVDEGVLGVNTVGTINFANPAVATLLGYAVEDLPGRNINELFEQTETVNGDCLVYPSCMSGVIISNQEAVFRCKDGSGIALEFSGKPLFDGERLEGAVVTLRDCSERKRYLKQLERQANHDELTGLPNRNLLNDRLTQAIDRQRREGGTVAVLIVALDQFKSINDRLGYATGNQVLHAVAERLDHAVRTMDTLARLIGEFVVVTEMTESDIASRLAQRLLAALTPPLRIAEREIFLTGSIGITVFPGDGEDGDALLRNATAAMHRARRDGGNGFQFYMAEMNARSLERLDMENALHRALSQNELTVHYQPQVSLQSGEITSIEALVRWQHPERGLIMPDEFIALAEDCDLIRALDEWVVRTACRQNKAWQDAGLPSLTMTVNLSMQHLAVQDVVKLVGSALAESGLAANHLELELSEDVIGAKAFIHASHQLKELEIKVSLDNFGVNFSSLNHLRRFAVDRLKIDQSLVAGITSDIHSEAIARAIISLAHVLKLTVVAEGVETEAQLNFLRRGGCDEIQGYYFSPPVPAAEMETLLRERRRLNLPFITQLPNQTLLLVDDEPDILSSLKRLFRRSGYTILTATSGAEGLELLARHEVGVVISDARMPQMSGGEFLGRVREIHPNVIRIMLSGYTDLKSVTQAVNSGELYCFLTKPWNDDELLAKVHDAFHRHESRRKGGQ
jgi:diguanylate cyclase (GGDEF)-like protein/PAS domain S-box-containing protein